MVTKPGNHQMNKQKKTRFTLERSTTVNNTLFYALHYALPCTSVTSKHLLRSILHSKGQKENKTRNKNLYRFHSLPWVTGYFLKGEDMRNTLGNWLTRFNNQLHFSLRLNEVTSSRTDIGTTVFCCQTVYLKSSSFHLGPLLWNVSFTFCPRDTGYWVSFCWTVQCDWLSVVTFYLLWRLDCKLRHHIDYESCHGVWCAQCIGSGADVCPCIFLVRLCYG